MGLRLEFKTIAPALAVIIASGSSFSYGDNSDPAVHVNAENDNSEVNKRDRSKGELTSDQQKVNKRDERLTRLIRQELVRDDSLSAYAQNVKIISVNGKVTLKGPVRTAAEEAKVLKSARTVAGVANVVNEITIAPKE